MHYYQFNIGDYASHTSRLSLMEDLSYRRLLDLYYLNERPLNGCCKTVAREIGMIDQIEEVEYILSKFFIKNKDGEWCQKRVDKEISSYQSKLKSASKAGKASAEARRLKASEQEFNDRSTTVQHESNDGATKHKPITNNHKPLTKETKEKTKRFVPPSLDEIKNLISEKKYFVDAEMFFNFYESNGWKVGKNKMKKWEATLAQWNSRNKKEAGITNQPSQPNLEAERFKKAMGIE